MTTEELCGLFSAEISTAFIENKDLLEKQLLDGATMDMTEQEVYTKMIINSMILSANLSAQVVITGLVSLGIIPKDALDSAKLKPQLHLVKPDEHQPHNSFFHSKE